MAGKPKAESTRLCPLFHRAVEVVGRRWSGAIIRILMDGPSRFCELRDAIPDLSDRLLSERLKELEDLNVIAREVRDEKPAVVTYRLTPQGLALRPALDALGEWAEKYLPRD